ncbi:MAG: hypothetical protein C0603_06985 [Denitrovibrio sp.]|mgnify:CR=1 FL=1|nr:MAG: hypothetical protein C0603_06985 [Denitrovibrio sp.]
MSVFDSRANEWDKKTRRVQLAKDVVSSIIKCAKPEKNIDIADFGTGTGLIMLGLADYAKSMVGYDSSQGMLDVLAEKSAEAGISNLQTVLFDLDNEKFPVEAFDMMTCSMVAHHLDNPEMFFSKAYDGIKKGGKLCLADLIITDEPFHEAPAQGEIKHEGFEVKWIEEVLLNAGYINVEIYQAAVIEKERDGKKLDFPVFLAVAEK